jgi:hypothetical protein
LTSARTPVPGRLDRATTARMRRLADAPLGQHPDVLVGTLREDDFDSHTARLRTATGETVTVDFPVELEDQIQNALRERATFEGIVTFDPATTTVKRVDLRRISNPEPLPFDSSAFWEKTSVAELAQAQGVEPATFDAPFGDWTQPELADIASALADLDA